MGDAAVELILMGAGRDEGELDGDGRGGAVSWEVWRAVMIYGSSHEQSVVSGRACRASPGSSEMARCCRESVEMEYNGLWSERREEASLPLSLYSLSQSLWEV